MSRWWLRETGGALLGWRDGPDAVVARGLGPGPRAQHGFRSFEPDAAWQVEQGRRIYRESNRTIAYIGDWHSHPIGALVPSAQDREAVETIATDPGFRAPQPLSAVVAGRLAGRRQFRLTVYLWRGQQFDEMEIVACRLGS